jgi:hypothetical protein
MKITVNPTGKWRLYQNTVPAGMTMRGTVSRNGIEVGALAKIEATGLYVEIGAGVTRNLPTDIALVMAMPNPMAQPDLVEG